MDFGAGVRKVALGALAMSSFLLAGGAVPSAAQTTQKPNILFIMGDDIGWMQVGVYQNGMGFDTTPNIDRIGKEGAMFMSYYAEQLYGWAQRVLHGHDPLAHRHD